MDKVGASPTRDVSVYLQMFATTQPRELAQGTTQVVPCDELVPNIHVLVKCLKVKEFWNLVLEYVKSKVTTTLLITPLNIIISYILAEVNPQSINTTVLVATKIYIYLSLQKNVKI